MKITWLGLDCFQIAVSERTNKVNIIIDPFNFNFGSKSKNLQPDVLIFSKKPETVREEKTTFVIDGAGEYDVKDVFVKGIPVKGENPEMIYTIEAEEIAICYLNESVQKELSDQLLEEIGQIDILMFPFPERRNSSSRDLIKIISQVEPRMVVTTSDSKEKREAIVQFLKELGSEPKEPEKELEVKKSELEQEEMKVIVLAA